MDFAQIMSSFGGGLYTIAAFVLALSVIVAVHEYGHYIVGRWTGIHAEVFSLGMGPVLYQRTDKRGTVWQIAALPFGGYVRFMGDANAAGVGGTGDVSDTDKRRSMAGAPLWARSLTVLAGPIFNFILAIAIFAVIAMTSGRSIDPLTYEAGRDLPSQFVSELQAGDQVLRVEGLAFGNNEPVIETLPYTPTLQYDIVRDGQPMTVTGPYLMPSAITGISPRSAADDAGLRKGDVITAVDGADVVAFAQLIETVTAADGKPLTLEVWRDGQTMDFTLAPRRVDIPRAEGGFEARYLIGVTGSVFFDEATANLGILESLTGGYTQLKFIISSSLSGLYHVIAGDISTCNLSGPVGIAQTSGSMAAQGATSFVWFLGMLSAAVGLLNLFPIPVLDGGHLVFYAYEAVMRRKPSVAAFNVLMMIGLGLIAAMMAFAMLNDLVLCP
ncbi:RIP metalloprotease RseP [Yoonia sp. MH D7]